MRIGMVCPYSFDIPGGVQAHVLDLAEEFLARGHHVSVIGPGRRGGELPNYVTTTGASVAIPYNGSVARLSFGPHHWSAVRDFINKGSFDILHIHEPNAPSLGMIALRLAQGPIVATFHASTDRSVVLKAATPILRPYLEKITGRIAVSDLARRWQVEALGGDAVLIPNGVSVSRFRDAPPFDGYPRRGGSVMFLGRFDEPRKGMGILLDALPTIVGNHPGVEILVAGKGNKDALLKRAGKYARSLNVLGSVDEEAKASALKSADVYVAPNLGGESFGIVLLEAMAAQTAVVASDLDAFRRVLRSADTGVLTPLGDGRGLGIAVSGLLSDPSKRTALVAAGNEWVGQYDWSVIADRVQMVYETVTVAAGRVSTI